VYLNPATADLNVQAYAFDGYDLYFILFFCR